MTSIFPPAALGSHIAILGKIGSGKSNLAKVVAELLMLDEQRVCVIDPTGTWWGLRLDRDGRRRSGFKPIIFGGAHADLALSDQHGTVLGEAVGTSADSSIIDVQQMTVGQRTRFATAFAESLMRANRGPLHLIIDEAHLFAPQGRVNDPQSGAMLHAFNNLVSLGRGRGLRIIMISQRPAKLHKDSLTQVETLVAMRLIAPQDRAAVKEWVGEWATDDKDIVGSLPSLATGEGWVWAPQLDYLQRSKFPLAATFDSGRPEANADIHDLPPIDLSSIGEKMDAIRQEAMANDPRQLKSRIATLEKQMRDAEQAHVSAAPHELEAEYDRGQKDGYDRGRTAGIAIGLARAQRALGELQIADIAAEPTGRIDRDTADRRRADQIMASRKPSGPVAADQNAAANARQERPAVQLPPASSGFTGPQTKILRAIAMWRALGNSAPTKSMISFVSGYSLKSSSFANTLGSLRSLGAIDYPSPGAVSLLVSGVDMTVDEGRQAFWATVTGPQRKFIEALAPAGELSREELSGATGYSLTSSSFANTLGEMRSLGLIDYPSKGRVALEKWVFDII